jgi:hypothetical protein
MERIPPQVERLFWDVDKKSVDVRAHRFYIIKRIMDYGNLEGIRWMMQNYTAKEITEVVRKSRGISRKSAYFWSAYYRIPLEEVECLKESSRLGPRPF